jgi:hypothetical protein
LGIAMNRSRKLLLIVVIAIGAAMTGWFISAPRHDDPVVSEAPFASLDSASQPKRPSFTLFDEEARRAMFPKLPTGSISVRVVDGDTVSIGGEDMTLRQMREKAQKEKWSDLPAVEIVVVDTRAFTDGVKVQRAIGDCGVQWIQMLTIPEKKYKAAQPGATDNPDDAQRFREDH